MNRYSKILHHLKENPESPKSSSKKKRTFEEYEADQKKTEVDRLKEQTQELTKNIEFLQNLVVNQHDEVYQLRQQLKNTPIPQPRKQLTEGLLNEPPSMKNSDPLTPLDQKYVTIQQLGDHYRLFTNRILEQMATIGGGGETQFKYLDDIRNFIFVGTKNDLPPAVNGVITLKDNYTYFFTTTVDLQGDRLVAGDNTTILGGSSENCRIKSTGISTTTALLSSVYSLPIRNITLEAPFAINLVASNPDVHALDWFGVNFTNCARVGIISSYNNFIMLDGAFLSSQDLTFNGVTGTVGFNQCLFTGQFPPGNPPAKSILNFPSTFICRRRIRVTVCSFVVPPGYTGITVQDGVTFRAANGTYNPESFILQTCNFSGPGITSTGILPNALGISTHTNINGNDSFYEGNRGIQNTFVVGQYYMKDSVEITTFAASNTWTKIAGVTTTAGVTNSKFTATDNRLTSNAVIDRKYSIQATISFEAGANPFTAKFGIYDSTVGIRTASSFTHIADNSVSHVSINDIVELNSGDYVEIHALNMDNTEGLRVIDMNVIASQLG